MESESTYGSSARSTYSRADHSVSIYICSTGAHGAAASLDHREQLCWSTWSSGSLGADTGAPVEHYGAAASLEHREQLCWSTLSSGSLGADAGISWSSCFPGAHRAALLVHMHAVELLNLLPERCCSVFSSGGTVSAPREPLLHMLQHSCSLCSREMLHVLK